MRPEAVSTGVSARFTIVAAAGGSSKIEPADVLACDGAGDAGCSATASGASPVARGIRDSDAKAAIAEGLLDLRRSYRKLNT